MKKSIYSLVLMDDVVAAVDEMAYELRTSRSNLINQILAEHLSCVTPEMRMQAVFSRMEELMQPLRMLEQTSAHMRSLQSRLDYKYKPTVQYSVELFRAPREDGIGRLRVQLRTQNQTLLSVLDSFFRLWVALEERYAPVRAVYQVAPGRFERSIQDADAGEEQLGEMIGAYVSRFDRWLKFWFSGLDTPQQTAAGIEAGFRSEAADPALMI